MPTPSLVQRLKERKLVQLALAYLAGAWVVYEAVDTIGDRWGLTDTFFQGLFVVLAIGFFITLVLAWYHGEKGRQKVSGPELLMVAALLVVAGVALSALGSPEGPEPQNPANSADGPPSVALLPPDVSGLNADEARFADGVADAIHTRLAPVSGLQVIAVNKAAQYDVTGKTPRQIGVDLGAEFLLVVDVLQEYPTDPGSRVRVTASLIRAPDGETVWSEPYEKPLGSWLDLHKEIAEQVVQKLDIHLAAPEREALESLPTDNPVAWDHFQQGERLWLSAGGNEANLAAADYFQRAIDADSMFAEAYARRAAVLFFVGGEEHTLRGQEALNQARLLDAGIPEIRHAQGALHYQRGQYELAADEWRAVLRVRPSDSEVLLFLGLIMRRQGKWDESLEALNRALEIDPLYPNLLENLAHTHIRLRNYTAAEDFALRVAAVSEGPGIIESALLQAWIRLQSSGDVAGAEAVLRRVADRVGLERVLSHLVAEEIYRFWFGLPDWGFREDLREHSAGTLGANPWNFYVARAASEEADGNLTGVTAYYDSLAVFGESRGWQGQGGSPFLSVAYAGLGRRDEAIEEAEAGVRRRPMSSDAYIGGPQSKMYLARTLVMVGEDDRAIELLDTLVTGIPSLWSTTWLGVHPFFDSLRDNPRFQALLGKSPSEMEP